MIDIVRVKLNIYLEEEYLAYWEHTYKQKPNGRRFRYCYLNLELENNVSIKCTYYPNNYVREPQLTIELSLPHIMFGNNFTMLYDIEKGISKANELLSTIPGLPPLDIGEGLVNRLDACYNHQVGDDLPYYIKALQSLKYPYRKTGPYTDQGVQFQSGEIVTKFYDKERECKDPRAKGILRQETQARKKALTRVTGIKTLKLQEISHNMLSDI